MLGRPTLLEHCERIAMCDPGHGDVGRAVLALAAATAEISKLVQLGPLAGDLGAAAGANADGDVQKMLDLQTHQIIVDALRGAPVAELASEESHAIEMLDPSASLAIAVDPLDGSSNIDTNISIGTIFSILPSAAEGEATLGAFGGKGSRQLAAGFVVYGPQTTLVLTMGFGVDVFTLDCRDNVYRMTREGVRIAEGVREYAINASNYRHWQTPVRIYIDDCLHGSVGPRGADFNMRWIGSLVAEAFRILSRGGIFLYPADDRSGYQHGRLRLLYEAAPMAFVIEQAGGLATNGRERILDLAPTTLHQRVPLVFGSADMVRHVERLHVDTTHEPGDSPLFAKRGLFRT